MTRRARVTLAALAVALAVLAGVVWVHDEGGFRGVAGVDLPDGRRFEGAFRGGLPHGYGVLTWPDGGRFVGEYREGVASTGVMTYPDGERYEGQFRGGIPDGVGVATWPDGTRYEGEWQDWNQHGQGVLTIPDGRRIEGEWRDGEPNGQGTITYSDGRHAEGEFRDGKFVEECSASTAALVDLFAKTLPFGGGGGARQCYVPANHNRAVAHSRGEFQDGEPLPSARGITGKGRR